MGLHTFIGHYRHKILIDVGNTIKTSIAFSMKMQNVNSTIREFGTKIPCLLNKTG